MQYMLTAIKVDGFKFKFPFANNIHFNYSFTSLRCAIGATFKHHLFVGMGSRWIFFQKMANGEFRPEGPRSELASERGRKAKAGGVLGAGLRATPQQLGNLGER